MWSTMARMGFEVRFETIEEETFHELRWLVDEDMAGGGGLIREEK
jgi:hypothetical protein